MSNSTFSYSPFDIDDQKQTILRFRSHIFSKYQVQVILLDVFPVK
jgi:hypothetical protein